jgi:hypothetical protein
MKDLLNRSANLQTSNTLEGHRTLLDQLDGLRINLMDSAEVPQGWVIDARKKDPLWSHMVPEVFPLKPRPAIFGFKSYEAKNADRELAENRKILEDTKAFVVMTPDPDGSSWWARPIRPSDLTREDPENMLQESLDQIGKNHLLADALQTAYSVRTGQFDMH